MRDAMNKLGSDSNKINPLVFVFLITCMLFFSVRLNTLMTVTEEISKISDLLLYYGIIICYVQYKNVFEFHVLLSGRLAIVLYLAYRDVNQFCLLSQ